MMITTILTLHVIIVITYNTTCPISPNTSPLTLNYYHNEMFWCLEKTLVHYNKFGLLGHMQPKIVHVAIIQWCMWPLYGGTYREQPVQWLMQHSGLWTDYKWLDLLHLCVQLLYISVVSLVLQIWAKIQWNCASVCDTGIKSWWLLY